MVSVIICVGSSCHLKDSNGVIEAFRKEVENWKLGDKVDLGTRFCFGKCECPGVVVKIQDQVYTGVEEKGVPALFEKEILPLLQEETTRRHPFL